MPGGYPAFQEIFNGNSNGVVTATSLGTGVVSGIANTKGAYSQLVASTASDTSWMTVCIYSGGTSAFTTAIDIAVGAAGSEKVIAANLIDPTISVGASIVYSFPMQIPAGTRIAARSQGDTATQTTDVHIVLHDGSFTQMEGIAGVDSIGFLTASSKGTTIDPGGTANTKGAYSQLSASTAVDYMGLMIAIDPLGASPATAGTVLLDIAIGAAASEKIIIPDLFFFHGLTVITPRVFGPFFVPISAGTRIAARARRSR